MKILLDENIPILLKSHFDSVFTIFTVREMKWSGKKNGELLKLMVSGGFDVLITLDQKLIHQQNLNMYQGKIVIMKTMNSKIETLLPLVQKLNSLLKNYPENKIIIVE